MNIIHFTFAAIVFVTATPVSVLSGGVDRPSSTIEHGAMAKDIASASPREIGHADAINGLAGRRGGETSSSTLSASVLDAGALDAKSVLEHTSTSPKTGSMNIMLSGASDLDPAGRVRLAQDPIVTNGLGVYEVASAGPAEVLREDVVADNVDVVAVDVAIDPRSDHEEVALTIGADSMVSNASNLDPTGRQFSKRIVASKRKLEQVRNVVDSFFS